HSADCTERVVQRSGNIPCHERDDQPSPLVAVARLDSEDYRPGLHTRLTSSLPHFLTNMATPKSRPSNESLFRELGSFCRDGMRDCCGEPVQSSHATHGSTAGDGLQRPPIVTHQAVSGVQYLSSCERLAIVLLAKAQARKRS